MIFNRVRPSGLTSIVVLCILMLMLTGCTENPFSGGDKVAASQISGQVTLSHETDFSGIYVWLEGFNISTFTDSEGEFTLSLPPPASQSGGEGVNGDFNLYFYVSNFSLDSVGVTILNGDLVKSTKEIDETGSLKENITLSKLLNVEVAPKQESASASESTIILVDVTLTSPRIDPVKTVMLRAHARTFLPLSALFLKKVDTQEEIIKMVDIGSHINLVNFIDSDLTLSYELRFELLPGELPAGEYQIIPYVMVGNMNPPVELINSLGDDVHEYHADFLNLPFKRSGGEFIIFE